MKRLTFIIIFVIQLLNVMAYDFEVDGIYYNIISEKTKTVEVTYKEKVDVGKPYEAYRCWYEGDVHIPEEVVYNQNTYKVTRIGGSAFASTSEDNEYTRYLKSVEIPNSVDTIYGRAFLNCKALKTLTLPSSIKYLGIDAFYGSGLGSCIFLGNKEPEYIRTYLNEPPFPKTCKMFVPQAKNFYTLRSLGYKVTEMVSPNATSFEYSGKLPDITWTCNLQDYKSEVFFENNNKNAGGYNTPVHIKLSKNDQEFYSYDYEYSYSIKKKPLTIEINDATRKYGEANPQFTYSNIKGFIEGEDKNCLDSPIELTSNADKFAGVGYTWSIEANLVDKNYCIDDKCRGILTIEKAPLIVKGKQLTEEYFYIFYPDIPSEYIEFEGLIEGETNPPNPYYFNVSCDYKYMDDIGEYTINVSGGESKNYYFEKYVPGKLTIIPFTEHLKAKDIERVYGEENPDFSLENEPGEEFVVKRPSFTTEATAKSPVGEYAIRVSGADLGKNIKIEYVDGTLTIKKRPLNVYVQECERMYKEDNPNFKVSFEGFVNGDSEGDIEEKPIATTTATKTSDVGEYKITTSGGNATNYDFTYHTNTLTIKKATQQITWNQNFDNIKVGDQVELLAQASSELPIDYRCATDKIETYEIGDKQYLDCQKVGQVTISAAQAGNHNYYGAQRVSKTFTIDEITGINSILADKENIKSYYDLAGKMLSAPQKGVIVIKYKDGKTKTVLIK